MRSTRDRTIKTKLDKKCKELLTQAESIKTSQEWHPIAADAIQLQKDPATTPQPSRRKLKEPLSTRELSTKEKIILLEGSKLNGGVFAPWKTEPDPSEFHLGLGAPLFEYVRPGTRLGEAFVDLLRDAIELPLSQAQLEIFDGWRRPDEIFAADGYRSNGDSPEDPPTSYASKVDLVQDLTSDCSVVASLCAVSSRAERGHPKVCSPSQLFLIRVNVLKGLVDFAVDILSL